MPLFRRLLHAVQSWRRRGGRTKPARQSGVSVEHLDHRQLLSVNFTGNVATDFPVASTPGVVTLPDNPGVRHPTIDPAIGPIVKVSGFDINGVRVSYTPTDDTLSIGVQQPPSMQPGQPGPVIAGDSDNNGNDGTVNPAVTAIKGSGFRDFAMFGGSESMGAFLDLKGSGYADVVAGYAINDPRSPKEYQVSQAVVDRTQLPTVPDFGTQLTNNTGNVYKVNSKAHPDLEFSITHFSQLYLAETGTPLTADSVVRVGAFGGSQDDLGIGEAFFPEAAVRIGDATPPVVPPPVPPVCPPVSPPVIINPHENRHINTAHPTLVRVNVLGSSGFDVSRIDPKTVTLGGAHPVFSFDRFINKDEWRDATFVFRGTDLNLPTGYTEATVTGNLTDGTRFSSSVKVFNRDRSFYSPGQNQGQMAREAAREARRNGFVVLPPGSPVAGRLAADAVPLGETVSVPGVTSSTPLNVVTSAPQTVAVPTRSRVAAPLTSQPAAPAPLKVSMVMPVAPTAAPRGPVVAINRRDPAPVASVAKTASGPQVSTRLQASINRYVRANGALNVGSGAPVSSAATGGA